MHALTSVIIVYIKGIYAAFAMKKRVHTHACMVMHTHENLRTIAPSAVGRAVPGGAGIRPGCAGTEGESTDGNEA